MSLTPKNWKSFQHYRDRAPIWIKLHRSLLDDFAFHRLPVASKALAPMLWLLASEYSDGEITAELDEIAFRFRMSRDDLDDALTPLIDGGFFVSSDPLAVRKRDAMPEKRREETERETETESRSIKDRPERAPSRFDEFWLAYPRRDGPNPRAPAEKKFHALVKSGVDPEMMIAEAGKLAQSESMRGNIGTRFIPQAVTWLNQQRWADHAAAAFMVDQAGGDLPIELAVSMFAKIGRWSRHAGPEPGQVGCRASAELLATYGIGPDGRKVVPQSGSSH